MIKGLIYLNADLASSIALRYVCQLAGMKEMVIDSMHVEETAQDAHTPGTGWVRKTWEKGVKENAGQKILQLVNAEKRSCINLSDPAIIVGDRDAEVRSTIALNTYDFFVEGLLQSFSSHNFKEKILSKLYQNISCPVLLVKNLVEINKVAIIIDKKENNNCLEEPLQKIIKDTDLTCELVKCELDTDSTGLNINETAAGQDDDIDDAKSFIEKRTGININKSIEIKGKPFDVAESLRDYGLVLMAVDKAISKKNPVLEMMSKITSALLICWV